MSFHRGLCLLRRTLPAWLLLLGLLGPPFSPTAADDARKSPIPDEAKQQEAAGLVKEIYGEEHARAKTPQEKQALAKKVLAKAEQTKKDLAGQFALLMFAREVAAQVGDGPTAFAAIDRMAEAFEVSALVLKREVLEQFSGMARTAAQHKVLAEQAALLMDEAAGNDDFAAANQVSELAAAEAQKAKDPRLARRIAARIAQIEAMAEEYQDVKQAEETLEAKPLDPEANLAVGKYRCFWKGDWANGLAMLALGNDKTLKELAVKELKGVVKPDAQATLGDGWWDLAAKQQGRVKRHLRQRAVQWYEKALPGLEGLRKDKLEKRIHEGRGGRADVPVKKQA